MLITISGPSGSGKSSVGQRLSEKLGIPMVDVGQLFRASAKEHGMDVVAFGKYAATHPDIDLELDAKMLDLARERPDLILQGRLSALLARREGLEAYKIWIAASQKTRAERIAKRDSISLAAALREIRSRDKDNHDRYLKTYGLDVDDRSVYDIVVPTDNRSVGQVVSILYKEYGRRDTKNRSPKRRQGRSG